MFLRRALHYLRTNNILSRPWFRLIVIVIVIPLILTIFHVWNWLSNHNCIILRLHRRRHSQTTGHFSDSSGSGEIHCYIPQIRSTIKASSSYDRNTQQQYPSIALLSSSFLALDFEDNNNNIYSISSVTPYIKWINADAKWDFFDPGPTDEIIQSYMDFTSSNINNNKRQQTQIQDSSSSTKTTTATTKYGFRSNPNKQIKKKPSKSIPITTIIFVAINVGLFIYYKQYSIRPESVALNSQLLPQQQQGGGDYGRAFSGNTAHFEIWHLGFNMMSTTSLGPILEQSHGSLSLLLYTISFLVLNTLMVIILHQLRVKFWTRSNNDNNNNNNVQQHNFPNMVGFSGILFAWMVVATLQDSNTQQCPIFFLPEFCFQTYKLWGKVNISWSPLVQLVFLQVILPRASFMGHLAGLFIGFVWQFHLLPSVEWIQPCILFPSVWWIGKYYYESSHQQQHNMDYSDGSTTSSSLSAPWSRQHDTNNNGSSNTAAEALSLLKRLQTILLLHSFIVLLIVDSFLTSLVVSQLILTAMLCIFCYQHNQHNHKKNDGRIMTMSTFVKGYTVLLLVVWMTDMMTLGGWFTLRILIFDWTANHYKIFTAFLFITSRIIIWWYSICVVGSIASKTTTTTTTTNEDGRGGGGGGIWNATIWWIIEPWCFTTIGGRKLRESSCWRKLQQQMTTITTASTDNHHHEMIPLNEQQQQQQQQQQYREDPTVETSQLL